jgi:hypothetical protein
METAIGITPKNLTEVVYWPRFIVHIAHLGEKTLPFKAGMRLSGGTPYF